MPLIWSLLPRKLKAVASGVLLVAVIAGGLIVWGASAERSRQSLKHAKDFIGGTIDARDSLSNLPDDPVDGLRSIPF